MSVQIFILCYFKQWFLLHWEYQERDTFRQEVGAWATEWNRKSREVDLCSIQKGDFMTDVEKDTKILLQRKKLLFWSDIALECTKWRVRGLDTICIRDWCNFKSQSIKNPCSMILWTYLLFFLLDKSLDCLLEPLALINDCHIGSIVP